MLPRFNQNGVERLYLPCVSFNLLRSAGVYYACTLLMSDYLLSI